MRKQSKSICYSDSCRFRLFKQRKVEPFCLWFVFNCCIKHTGFNVIMVIATKEKNIAKGVSKSRIFYHESGPFILIYYVLKKEIVLSFNILSPDVIFIETITKVMINLWLRKWFKPRRNLFKNFSLHGL